MRIILHIIQLASDVNSTGVLMEQVCEELLTYGHEVFVVTGFPHYTQFRVWDAYCKFES
jgi:hypothetical protein